MITKFPCFSSRRRHTRYWRDWSSDVCSSDLIIVTKHLCLEGSSIIVNDYYERARQILKEDEIKEAKNYVKYISVIKEGKIAGDFGVNSMHDITEGGLLGALWEVAEGSNVGFKI